MPVPTLAVAAVAAERVARRRKIHVLARHCWYSAAGGAKPRPPWFDREGLFARLLSTADEDTSVTVLFDGDPAGHFTTQAITPKAAVVRKISGGTEARAFLALLEHAAEAMDRGDIAPDDIVYSCEDDYLHVPGWPDALREGLCDAGYDYVSLYDHPDKYPTKPSEADAAMIRHAGSFVRVTDSCHWRATPSTTNTFACLASTLAKDLGIHAAFSRVGDITADHEKFVYLWRANRTLGTALPAFATHVETGMLAPLRDWAAEASNCLSGA